MNNNFNPRRKYLSSIHPKIWTNDNEEEMAMISRKFRKFLKQSKLNPLYFKCNKLGYIKKDLPIAKIQRELQDFQQIQ